VTVAEVVGALALDSIREQIRGASFYGLFTIIEMGVRFPSPAYTAEHQRLTSQSKFIEPVGRNSSRITSIIVNHLT
jgi:hypothetical protein